MTVSRDENTSGITPVRLPRLYTYVSITDETEDAVTHNGLYLAYIQ